MKKFLLAASAVAAALAVAPAANAAEFVVTGGSLQAVPGNNDFKTDLAGLLLTKELIGAKVTLSAGTTIKFEFLGTESGYTDTLYFSDGLVWTEHNQPYPALNLFGAPQELGNYYNPTGDFLAWFGSDGSDAKIADALGGVNKAGFTVFVGDSGVYDPSSGVLYFGYDDVPKPVNGTDDNHDDFVVKATIVAVPEPATWALMIAGIAAVGVSMRRRPRNVRVSFS